MISTTEIEKPRSVYRSTLKITDDVRGYSDRREARAEELGIALYVLGVEEKNEELQKLEDYIIDNFIDMDLDVPENIKQRYLILKSELNGD